MSVVSLFRITIYSLNYLCKTMITCCETLDKSVNMLLMSRETVTMDKFIEGLEAEMGRKLYIISLIEEWFHNVREFTIDYLKVSDNSDECKGSENLKCYSFREEGLRERWR